MFRIWIYLILTTLKRVRASPPRLAQISAISERKEDRALIYPNIRQLYFWNRYCEQIILQIQSVDVCLIIGISQRPSFSKFCLWVSSKAWNPSTPCHVKLRKWSPLPHSFSTYSMQPKLNRRTTVDPQQMREPNQTPRFNWPKSHCCCRHASAEQFAHGSKLIDINQFNEKLKITHFPKFSLPLKMTYHIRTQNFRSELNCPQTTSSTEIYCVIYSCEWRSHSIHHQFWIDNGTRTHVVDTAKGDRNSGLSKV